MKNPFSALNAFERLLWIGSLIAIILSFVLCGSFDYLVLSASLIGATALIFVSKGDPTGQILTVVFALFYGYISFEFRYWGEMITYLGMTSPIAIAATVAWFKNPYEKGKAEVKVAVLGRLTKIILLLASIAVTVVFYFILKYFDTPNLIISTISVFTSFLASMLTLFRSPYYALAYAANDIVLIVLWVLAAIVEPSYIPMIMCFIIFLINDAYGFYSWKRIQIRQSRGVIP